MAKIPPPTDNLPARIYAAYQQREAATRKPRPHLGASVIGHQCERWIWLQFRWAVLEEFDGRLLRLFNRGQREEAVIVSDLKAAGVEITDFDPKTRRQYSIKDGHLGGSLDGIITSGVPEAPNKKHIAEFKTHNVKSFDAMAKDGVEKSKPQHFAQMQVYMHYTAIDRALYVAVCKDNDRIYTERVRYEKEKALFFIDRAKRLIASDRMPEPLSADPTWWECKMCAAHNLCHGGGWTKEANCRTCAKSTALDDGTWHCAQWDALIPSTEAQVDGCDHHVLHPDLVPWQRKASDDGESAVYVIDGKEVVNGANGYKSREIVANPTACAGQKIVEEAKRLFSGAEIVQ